MSEKEMSIEISQPCTLIMLIQALEKAREKYGDLLVEVSGAYASTGDIFAIRYSNSGVIIITDVFSG